jgi:AraC-like DNA-binding protein
MIPETRPDLIYHALEYIPDGTRNIFPPGRPFRFPLWWRAQEGRTDVQRLELLDRFRAIEFHSGDSPKGNDSALVEISKLDLVRPDPLFVWTGRGLLAAGLALLAIVFLKRRPPQIPEQAGAIPLVGEPVTMDDPRSRQSAKLVQDLKERFSDPNLSLESFAQTQGMPPRLVASLLKEATHLHFKGALNELRLTEAARLLGESSANISEIAFAVGFQNLSPFRSGLSGKIRCLSQRLSRGQERSELISDSAKLADLFPKTCEMTALQVSQNLPGGFAEHVARVGTIFLPIRQLT